MCTIYTISELNRNKEFTIPYYVNYKLASKYGKALLDLTGFLSYKLAMADDMASPKYTMLKGRF